MANTPQEDYVFENLIEGSLRRSDLGGKVKFVPADASTNKNAAGVVHEMTFEEVGARARKFGARFNAMAGTRRAKP